jgi:hypothetical protein
MTKRDLNLEQAKEIIRAAFDDWAAQPGGPYTLLATDDTWTDVGNTPVSRTFNSRQEFLDVVIDPFNARFANPLVRIGRALCTDGDTSLPSSTPPPLPAHGKPYNNTYTWYSRAATGAT